MRRSHHETPPEPSDTIRYIRRKEEERPAPPPYIGQAIPRVKPIRTFQKGSNNNSVGENSRPTSRRFDTFGENALETIYDQFKFLDESEEQPSETPTSVNSSRPIMEGPNKKRNGERRPAMILYCVLPTLELLAAIAIIATSFLTNRKNWETKDVDASSDSSEAIRSLSVQNALSTVVPAFFQSVSALFGFWPIWPRSLRRPAQLLHILFNSIVVLLWLNTIFDFFFKISMEHILGGSSDEKYVIDLLVASFLYFATVVLPGITLSVAVFNLATSSGPTIHKSLTAISVSLGTVIFSLGTLVIAIFTAQANLNGPKNLSESSTTYAYGLKEAIVFVFVVLVSIFSLIASTQSSRPLMIASIIGQSICILSITSELFTSDRISAVFNELKNFETGGTTIEIGIVLLNGCAVVSLLVLVLQLITFTFSTASDGGSECSTGSAHSLLLLDNNRNPSGGARVERTAF
ncbi:unnamed protein product [Caenorhabditis sp. 36 PRJEB53466]|nr:unnamed protein product [Caenorhabditis sp. 36 PRJEB53466]